MKRYQFFFMLMFFYSASTLAFDAQTMLINTSIQNEDVKSALSQGLTIDFDKTFPSTQYGVYVLVDKTKEKATNKDMIYIFLGLCKIRSDGSYGLPMMAISTNLPFTTSVTEKANIIKRLTLDSNGFSQVMVANAAKVKGVP